jgi:hypothetical protein
VKFLRDVFAGTEVMPGMHRFLRFDCNGVGTWNGGELSRSVAVAFSDCRDGL